MESWARLRARCRVDVLAADHRSKAGKRRQTGAREIQGMARQEPLCRQRCQEGQERRT